jgi:hypothetical protein
LLLLDGVVLPEPPSIALATPVESTINPFAFASPEYS